MIYITMQSFLEVHYHNIPIMFQVGKGELSFTFSYQGKKYGHKVELPSKKADIVGTTATLLVNALESIEYHEANK